MFDRCYSWNLLKKKIFCSGPSLSVFESGSIIQRKLGVVSIASDILSYAYAVLEGVGAYLLPAELGEI